MQIVLTHVVGKSTLNEGFAIPRDFEDWVCAPERGSKREIRLVFDEQSIPVTLRRIDNEQGRVQVKYENKAGEPFRAWLASVFPTAQSGSSEDYFEINKIGSDTFKVSPFPSNASSGPSLNIEQWLFHRGADKLLEQDTPLAEIPAVVHRVAFVPQQGQSYYNQAFSNSFRYWNWHSECRVIPELGLKCDFAKDGVQVEVEFGNARTYYQDFIKFLLGNRYCSVGLGVLVIPTASFAKHLCVVGRERAIAKGRKQYSGMIDFDKVRREFHYLEFMIPMPIAIAGISSAAI